MRHGAAPTAPHGITATAGAVPPRHARDVLREVHRALVKDGIRDEVTLVASGGIAQAEHMAKAIICGADLVAIDFPLLLALECRLCGECERGEPCPIAWRRSTPISPSRRIENLIGAWHQQLIEVLGRDGHPRGPPPAGRDGPGDVLRGPGTRHVRPALRQAERRARKGPSEHEHCIRRTARPLAPTAGRRRSRRPDYAEVSREVRPAPPRYRNEIGKFSIRRASTCVSLRPLRRAVSRTACIAGRRAIGR